MFYGALQPCTLYAYKAFFYVAKRPIYCPIIQASGDFAIKKTCKSCNGK